MTITRLAASASGSAPTPLNVSAYEPGVCNIGPAEIARRRRTGATMTLATVGLLAILVAIHAPATLRLLLFLPAAVAASGYIQAWLKFCAGFGWLGVFNFLEVGTTDSVQSAEARRRDRAMAIRIGIASAIVGAVVAIAAVVVPV